MEKSILIRCYVEDELDGRASYPRCIEWACEWLKSHNEINHDIASLASLQPNDFEEVRKYAALIIGREITPQEKQELMGQRIRELASSSIDDWGMVDELIKMKDFLEDSDWVEWVIGDADTLDADEREEFQANIKNELNYVVDLWEKYPSYNEFKLHFNPKKEAPQMVLKGSHFDEQEFQFANFSKQSLESRTFVSCIFENCDFTESILWNSKFYSCRFVNCNISLPKLDGCLLQDVRFVNCKLMGVEFFKLVKSLLTLSFEKCMLQYCNFSDLTLNKTSFHGSKMKECHFTNTLLKEADFTEVDLLGTVFHSCDLSKSDFSKATSYTIDPLTNKIGKAKFSLPEALALLRGLDITLIE